MSEPVVLVDKDGSGCAVVTLNRPRALNALSRELRRALVDTFDGLADDPGARVIVLTGAGRGFCAGLDLKELGAGSGERVEVASSERRSVLDAMAAFPGPIIGAINGAAVTGGFELALACDILLASSEARFADTHARIGLMPGWGLSQKLPRLVGVYRAKEISLTGNFVSAVEAERIGLVNRVVAPADLLPAARKLAADMLSAEPHMLRAMKKIIDDGFAMSLGEALVMERTVSRLSNDRVRPGEIEGRREAVRNRGKSQQS
ncbi:MAG: enoyl-CoA hydratase [Hyphomicrobiales bacterium]|nr:enoyl-CoA hydratase [Hyphomicrobiales bacterium]